MLACIAVISLRILSAVPLLLPIIASDSRTLLRIIGPMVAYS